MDSDDKKITQLSVGFPELADLIPYVSSPGSSPQTKSAYISSLLGRGYIQENSAQLLYVGAQAYSVLPGSADVNGTLLAWSANIARTSLSLTADTIYYVYLYSNSGTPAVEESTTVPVWDSALNYYKKTGDATRRCIGFIEASATNTIRKFINTVSGRDSEFTYVDGSTTGVQPVSATVSESAWTSFSLAPVVPSHATHVSFIPKIIAAAISDDMVVGLSPIDLGSGVTAGLAQNYIRGTTITSTGNIVAGAAWNPIFTSQTYYYRTLRISGSPNATIEIKGARIVR